MKKKRILIAPLDWGLGHATRCIPIINELVSRDVDVVVAADNRPAMLLKKEFPQLEHIRYPGYVIDYPVDANMAWTMFRQLPKLFRGIAREQALLESLVQEHHIEAVISDNRWGAYSKKVPSIYLVHQLRILLSSSIRWGQGIVDRVNGMLIKPYTEIWIPDFDGDNNLSGELSSPSLRPKNSYCIGPLSRLKKITAANKVLDVLAILSGPEPQRTIFENLLVDQLKKTTIKTLIVRGMPEQATKIKLSETLTLVSSLSSDELSEVIATSKVIVSRPGYSTIMDLSFLGANAIFVPTPQQTEQEYLAKRSMEQNICFSVPQENFNIIEALTRYESFSGFNSTQQDFRQLGRRIDHLLTAIP